MSVELTLLIWSAALAFAYLALRRRPQAKRKSMRAPEPAWSSAPAVDVGRAHETPRDAQAELHALYRSGLSALAQRGLLTLATSATNGQYLRALPSTRERALLAELTRMFERSRYGANVPSEGEMQRARELAADLCAEALS